MSVAPSIGVNGTVRQFEGLETADETRVLHVLSEAGEQLAHLYEAAREPSAIGAPHDWWVRRLHQSLETVRVKRHPEWSSRVHDASEGVTTDTLCFHVEALAAELRQLYSTRGGELPAVLSNASPETRTHWLWKTNTKPMTEWFPVEVSAAIACIFRHARRINWIEEEFRTYVAQLQWQCWRWTAVHLHDPTGKAWPGTDLATTVHHIVLWSCATARIKRATMQHAYAERAPPGRELAHTDSLDGEAVKRWVKRTVRTWNGPRLREAIGRAVKRRDLRADETGRVAAFAGGNTLQRARGALDVIETTLHEIDYERVLDSVECTPAMLDIREILTLRLVHNTMEAMGIGDFMGTCCSLCGLRSPLHVHRTNGPPMLVELRGGWLVTPPRDRCTDGTSSLEEALAVWYVAKFGSHDPFGFRELREV